MRKAIPKGSIVYIRYKDHVLFRNISRPVNGAVERETVGWLTQENKELLCIQHDRTIENIHHSNGAASGLVILKSCVQGICVLPSKDFPCWFLVCKNSKTNGAKYALQNEKRKTQPNINGTRQERDL
jgi:hypothetical protein